MPLSKIHSDVLKVIASRRDPESYIADGTPLNQDGPRFSEDIDVFHDREQRVSSAALSDAQALEAEDYEIKWLRQSPAMYTAEVTRENARTRLEWVADSDFRFFPNHPGRGFRIPPASGGSCYQQSYGSSRAAGSSRPGGSCDCS